MSDAARERAAAAGERFAGLTGCHDFDGFTPVMHETAFVRPLAAVMGNVSIGRDVFIGTLSFVPGKMEIPARKVVVGNPARIVKDVSDEMLHAKTEGTALRQRLPAEYHATMRPVQPLREVPTNRPAAQDVDYRAWNDTKTR